MGRREWERGELTLSSAEFPKFKKALIEALALRQADLLLRARTIYDELIQTDTAEKGQPLESRVDRRLEALQRTATRSVSQGRGYGSFPERRPLYDDTDQYALRRALIGDAWARPVILKRPSASDPAFQATPLPSTGDPKRALVRASNQQKAAMLAHARLIFGKVSEDPSAGSVADKVERLMRAHPVDPILLPQAHRTIVSALVVRQPARLKRPTTKDFPPPKAGELAFHAGEVSLSLNPTKRMVLWEVSESKGAVTDAWNSHLGRTFELLLSKVTWTRGTGGRFWGNDEYSEDNDREMGTGESSYTTRHFGPLGEAHDPFRQVTKAAPRPRRR